MKSLIKNLELVLRREFPEIKFKIEVVTGNHSAEFGTMKVYEVHDAVILYFTIGKKRIAYRYVRASESYVEKDHKKKARKEVLKSLEMALLNNVVFGTDYMSIPELLSGRVQPLADLIIDPNN